MIGIGLLLLALGFGCKVFADATANTRKGLQILGRAIGLFIMIASVGAIICTAASCGFGMYGGKGMMGKKFCPFSKAAKQPLTQTGDTIAVN